MPNDDTPSSLSLLYQFLTKNALSNLNFWKYIAVYTIVFNGSWLIFDKLYYPMIHKKAISISNKFSNTTQSSQDQSESLTKLKHNISHSDLANNSSRCVSFTHTLLGCIAAVHFWRKYNHSISQLTHPALIKCHPDEVSALDITSGHNPFLSRSVVQGFPVHRVNFEIYPWLSL